MTINYATRKQLVLRAFEGSKLQRALAIAEADEVDVVHHLLGGLDASRCDVDMAPTPEIAEATVVRYLESSINEVLRQGRASRRVHQTLRHEMAIELAARTQEEFARFMDENPEPDSSLADATPDLSAHRTDAKDYAQVLRDQYEQYVQQRKEEQRIEAQLLQQIDHARWNGPGHGYSATTHPDGGAIDLAPDVDLWGEHIERISAVQATAPNRVAPAAVAGTPEPTGPLDAMRRTLRRWKVAP